MQRDGDADEKSKGEKDVRRTHVMLPANDTKTQSGVWLSALHPKTRTGLSKRFDVIANSLGDRQVFVAFEEFLELLPREKVIGGFLNEVRRWNLPYHGNEDCYGPQTLRQ